MSLQYMRFIRSYVKTPNFQPHALERKEQGSKSKGGGEWIKGEIIKCQKKSKEQKAANQE